jgi:hypothetical protein
MAATDLLFDINGLNSEEQRKFHTVYNELKSKQTSYLQYKLDLQLKTTLNDEEEENEWCYELHRHLRARKWNVAHTIKSLLEMIQWRIDNRVDLILEDQSASLRVDLVRKSIPNANHGYTKAHRPLYIEKTGQMNVDDMLNRFTFDELIQCHLYWLEFNCRLVRDRSRQVGKHVESFSMIYDLNGCKMDMRKLLPLLRQSLFVDNNYYPERLGQMFLVNPPAIFPILWNLTKPLLDPVTKAKVIVVKKGPETAATLLQYIDSDQLPYEYGGTCHSCLTSPDCIPVYDRSKDTVDDKGKEY